MSLNLLLIFTPGTQNMTITLHAFEDSVVESELEWFSLALDTLFVPAGRVVFTVPNATVFIEDTNSKTLYSLYMLPLAVCAPLLNF